MPAENMTDVKTYLDANKENEEVKLFVNGFANLDVFKGKLANDTDFKSFMDSERDKHSTKSLDTWKTNNLQALIDAKVKELHPDADPRDTALNTLKAELEKMKAEGQHKELTIKASKMMQEKKLPMELLDLLIGTDEAVTTANLTALETVFKSHVEALVAERLKGGYVPPAGTPPVGSKNPWKQGPDYNLTEQGRIYVENPTLAAQYMAQAK